MSGKEAIHAVRLMTVGEVRRVRLTSNDAQLRSVAGWRLHDPAGWTALLRDMGLIETVRPGKSSPSDGFSRSVHRSTTYAELQKRLAKDGRLPDDSVRP